MELVRLGKSPFKRREYSVIRNEQDGNVEVRFLGPENTSDFRTDMTWEDVENLISEFATMKEPKAIFLRQANSLAISARRAGWKPVG
ncbi:hypothetical protein [Bradyrhizobium sp. th.b2]|uniref:hypothetical protein n=1 Tax=Bradyrhizobium sp. th-b2 TaxID=172088 RepID=UPI000418B487|nr:hypothetical protein [Bradyrhizobium sp. th.b2]